MANRLNYYFRQKVSESELDEGFELLEQADRDFVTDLQLVGITDGLAVTQRGAGANLTVDVSAGVAYDKDGQRIFTSSLQNVSVSADENAVTTAVSNPGNSKIIALFFKFKRTLTDPRTDGNSVTVFFSEAESFEFKVRQGTEAGSPTPPALDPEYILLADITRTFGDTQILNAAINVTGRREDVFVQTGTFNTRRGRIKDVIGDIYTAMNSGGASLAAHLADGVDAHDASAISYLGSAAWADATAVVATDVEAALDEIVSDLTATTGDVKVGSPARAASVVFGLSAGSVGTQLNEIQDYLDLGARGREVATITGNTTLGVHRQVNVDTSGGAFNVTLPAPAKDKEYYLKDPKGTWDTNNMTLVRNGGEKIENVAASRVFAGAFSSLRIYSDGTDWFIG